MKTRVSLEEAQELLLEQILPIDEETVSLTDAHQRVLAQDVYSPIDHPPFDRSPLDGYALRSADSKGASKENPIKLKVIEEVFAGGYPEKDLTEFTACRIMTGAPLPKGADCVIRQEETEESSDSVMIFQELFVHENFSFKGEDVKKGSLVLKEGTTLNYVGIGILASMGMAEIPVYKIPKVAVLSTGDELMQPGQELLPGKIYNSNMYTIGMRLAEFGMKTVLRGGAKDDLDGICEQIRAAIADADILITSGGVSVGKKDLLKEALAKLGAEILFWKLSMKPGTPALCSVLDGKPVLSLSGNPAAATITFELLARPALAKYAHRQDLVLQKTAAIMQDDFYKESKSRRFVRAKLRTDGSSQFVELSGKHSPGILSSLADCNGFIDVPANSPPLRKGQEVVVIRL